MRDRRLSPAPTLTRLLAGGAIAFAAAHVIFIAAGVRYHDKLDAYWEYVDPQLLTTRLFESLYYLHAQPPLFNLFLGGVLKLFPARYVVALNVLYLLAGLGLYLCLLVLMRRLGVSPALAFALATAFMVSPAFVLYEHLLFYMLPIALLILVSHLVLWEALERARRAWLLGFFTIVAALCALQSVFHLTYYLAVVGTVAALGPGHRRRIVGASLPPLGALCLLYAKNLYLFGILTTSSWSGMHLADMTVEFLPAAERARLVADGGLSRVSSVRPFSPAEAYPPDYFHAPAWAHVPVLAAVHTSKGTANYHHAGYLAISRQYRADAIRTARTHPSAVARALRRAWSAYFKPSTDYFGLEPNRSRIDGWRHVFDAVILGRALWPGHARPGADPPALFLVLGLPLAFGFGLSRVCRDGADGAAPTASERAVLGLMCLDIAYVTLVVNSLTAGENARFRFVIDPLSTVLLAVLIERGLAFRFRRWRGGGGGAGP